MQDDLAVVQEYLRKLEAWYDVPLKNTDKISLDGTQEITVAELERLRAQVSLGLLPEHVVSGKLTAIVKNADLSLEKLQYLAQLLGYRISLNEGGFIRIYPSNQ